MTQGDAGLIRFIQQFLGYCLTGITREHALLFIFGPGGNGKTVLLETMVGILGDYAQTAAMDTFVASRHDRHPTELAALRGARLVAAAETEQGRAWNETKIKQLTGGDSIAARFMRQDFFTFKPEFKPVFIGNHKPRLRDVGTSTRRRFNIVPFMFKPETEDKQLTKKLESEHPGILRWLIEGCLDWQEHGLVRPEVVTQATDDYFNEQDIVARWVEEHCDTSKAFFHDTTTHLFADFCRYAEAANERPCTHMEFKQEMERLGYPRRKVEVRQDVHYKKSCYWGLALKPEYQ